MNLSDDILDTLANKTGQPESPTPVRPEAPPLPPDSVAEEVYTDPKGNVRQAGATDYNGEFIKIIRQYAERSLYFFARAILRFDRLVPGLHGEMCSFLTKHPPHRKMLLIPRDCFKTTVASKSMPLHKFIQPKEHNIYWPGHDGLETKILLACEVVSRAQKHILWMEEQMLRNRLLRGLWPEKFWEEPRREARAWNSNEFYLPREIHMDQSDPSLMGAGVGQAVTGAHFTDIIKDDLISLEAAQFPIVMQRAIEWHIPSRALLEDQEYSNEYLIGTKWSVDDLYAWIMRNDPTVSCYIRSLVEGGKSIFPEEFPDHVIPRMKEEYGPLFPLLYQNNAKDAALVDFQESQLRWYEEINNEFVFTEDPRDAQLMDTLSAPSAEQNKEELRPEPRFRKLSSISELEAPDRDTYLRLKYS